MSAYAIAHQWQLPSPTNDRTRRPGAGGRRAGDTEVASIAHLPVAEPSTVDALILALAERIAAAVAVQLKANQEPAVPEWLDSRGAADYLGIHRDTLRKLAAERAIPTHQDGPRCKLFFRRSDLDEWRHKGGRVVQLSAIANAA